MRWCKQYQFHRAHSDPPCCASPTLYTTAWQTRSRSCSGRGAIIFCLSGVSCLPAQLTARILSSTGHPGLAQKVLAVPPRFQSADMEGVGWLPAPHPVSCQHRRVPIHPSCSSAAMRTELSWAVFFHSSWRGTMGAFLHWLTLDSALSHFTMIKWQGTD